MFATLYPMQMLMNEKLRQHVKENDRTLILWYDIIEIEPLDY